MIQEGDTGRLYTIFWCCEKIRILGLEDRFIDNYGTQEELLAKNNLTVERLIKEEEEIHEYSDSLDEKIPQKKRLYKIKYI